MLSSAGRGTLWKYHVSRQSTPPNKDLFSPCGCGTPRAYGRTICRQGHHPFILSTLCSTTPVSPSGSPGLDRASGRISRKQACRILFGNVKVTASRHRTACDVERIEPGEWYEGGRLLTLEYPSLIPARGRAVAFHYFTLPLPADYPLPPLPRALVRRSSAAF